MILIQGAQAVAGDRRRLDVEAERGAGQAREHLARPGLAGDHLDVDVEQLEQVDGELPAARDARGCRDVLAQNRAVVGMQRAGAGNLKVGASEPKAHAGVGALASSVAIGSFGRAAWRRRAETWRLASPCRASYRVRYGSRLAPRAWAAVCALMRRFLGGLPSDASEAAPSLCSLEGGLLRVPGSHSVTS